MRTVFCLLNCFDNYSIVAGKLIEFYIQNAGKANGALLQTKTFFENTPYVFYSMYMSSGASPVGEARSKQFTDYITILCLTAVTAAHISNSDATVFAMQGVVPNPGFATMYAVANQLNKVTAYWTDDLRNLWGTSDNPLMIGMAPLPYKYLWSADVKADQDSSFDPQPKGLNGPGVVPTLGSSEDKCPKMSEKQVKDKWNTFISLLKTGKDVEAQNYGGVSQRTRNLIKLGNALIQYILYDKIGTKGWIPTVNTYLYWDMEYVIGQNLNLLYKEEQAFFAANTRKTESFRHGKAGPQTLRGIQRQTNDTVGRSMALGMERMLKKNM